MNNKRIKSLSLEGDSTQGRDDSFGVGPDDRILITGAAGFIGCHVVKSLVNLGFRNLVCFTKPSSELAGIEAIIERRPPGTRIEIIKGNLLSRVDCEAACKHVAVILHLAAGTGEKSFPDAFMNSVVTTRNLLEATLRQCATSKICSG